MGTQNSNDKAKYAHLKRDILGDGIKESKLTAYEHLVKNISGNAGDGSESLPVYGIVWLEEYKMIVFEAENVIDSISIINDVKQNDRSGADFGNVNVLFDGEVDSYGVYTDSDRDIAIDQPSISIFSINVGMEDEVKIYESERPRDNILEALNLNKGLYVVYYDAVPDYMFGYFDSSGEHGYVGVGLFGTSTSSTDIPSIGR